LAFYFFNTVALLSLLGCNEPAYACGGTGVVEYASAAQNVRARVCPGAEMVLASSVLNIQRQLASGKRSCAENRGGHRRKEDVFDFPIHGHSFFVTSWRKATAPTLPGRWLNSRGMRGAKARG